MPDGRDCGQEIGDTESWMALLPGSEMLALSTLCSLDTCILLRIPSLSSLFLESISQNLPVLLPMSGYHSF